MDPQQSNGHEPGKVLRVLFIGVFMAALDISIVGPALPAIQTYFGADERGLSWVFGIYILFQLVGAPVMAKLSDRAGRRAVYVACVAVFAAASLLVATSPTFAVLLTGRAIQGFCAGGILPVASAVIGDTFPAERRGRALGLIGAVFGVAFLLGPLVGGILLRWGWQWLFLLNLPLAAVVSWQAIRVLPTERHATGLPIDWLGIGLLSVMLAALAWGISALDAGALVASASSSPVLPSLLLAAVCLPALWLAQKRAADPVLHPELLRSTELRLVGVIALATGLAEAGMVFLPSFAVAGLRVPETTASFMMVPLVLALIVGAPTAGRLSDKFGPKRVIQVGLMITVVGLLVFSLVPLTRVSFFTAGVCIGLGLSALMAPLRFVVIREVSAAQRGAAQGLLVTCLGIGRLTGAAMVGGVAASHANQTTGYQDALLLAAGVVAVATIVSAALKGRPAAGQPTEQNRSA
ncbi:MAG: MFS transporter [Gammaproteobacteria bacterium]